MARNRYAGTCYLCGRRVEADTGHFERHLGGWRIKHANVSGDGRVTCEAVAGIDAGRRALAEAEGK